MKWPLEIHSFWQFGLNRKRTNMSLNQTCPSPSLYMLSSPLSLSTSQYDVERDFTVLVKDFNYQPLFLSTVVSKGYKSAYNNHAEREISLSKERYTVSLFFPPSMPHTHTHIYIHIQWNPSTTLSESWKLRVLGRCSLDGEVVSAILYTEVKTIIQS